MARDTDSKPPDAVREVSPARLLAVTTTAVFVTEFAIMGLFGLFPRLGFWSEAVVDAGLLSGLVFPVLYITTFRPLLKQIEERRRAERALQDAYGELDVRVRARTAELAQANEALRQERNFVNAVVETAGALVVVLDSEGRIVRFNKACERTSGYGFDEVRGQSLFPLLIPPEEAEAVTETFCRLTDGDFPNELENHWLARDGSRRYISWANTVITGADGSVEFVVGTGLDVTENRRAQEALRASEERNRAILRTAQDGFWVVDAEGRFLDVNDAYCGLSGYSREELLTMSIQEVEVEATGHEVAGDIARVKALGHDRFETRHQAKDGHRFDVEVNVAYLPHSGGQFFTFLRDVTARKAAEAQIRASLREKEVLLKEIHHRVKNNLQVIASMLNLQAGRVDDDEVVGTLLQSQNRIRTLALIHEKLYRSADLAHIPFREYVQDLARWLVVSLSPAHASISIEVDVGDLALGIDTAIPVALMVNELVSNCVKHAFVDDANGRITISLRPTDPGRYLLAVTDNGRGLPADIDHRRASSLGLQLVDVLATQLGGSVVARNDNGARFEIAFADDR
jgi:PAS domain S-box-containing protein